ncbi:docking protein 5-like [Pristis pectinata]|uniref:docking protein 5-like n=1 Tax=Pristis pectinata TaxID=685728 RepID=UPI00223CC6D7|nr:docking protein 5-like [Pristis pectinata]
MEKPIKEGILHIQQYKFGMKIWKKSWFMLYPGSSQSIARLEQSDAKEGSISMDKSISKKVERIIRLSNCISICQIQVENTPKDMSAFCISTMDKNWILAAPKQDLMQWINCLCELAFGNATVRKKSEDFSASSSKLSSDSFSMKDNELYSSIAQAMPDNHFTVTVQKTAATTRCNLQGKHTLIVGKDSLVLKDPVTKKVVYKWPYQLLRRYGTDQEAFMFEAGRRCDSGEGVFLFNTKEDGKIYNIVDTVVKALESNKEHQPLKSTSETSTGPGRKLSNAVSFPQELDNQKSQGGSGHALKIEQDTTKGSKTTKSKSNQDWKGYNSACGVESSAETVGKSKVTSTEETEREQVVYATVKLPKAKSTKGNMKNLTLDPMEYREGGEDDDSETSPVYENISEREFPFFFKEESSSLKDIERPTYQRSGESTEDKNKFSDSDYENLATEWSHQVTEGDYENAQVNQKIDVYTTVDRKKNKERGASPNPETSKITKAKLPPGFHEMLSDLYAVELSKTRDATAPRKDKIQQHQGKKKTGKDCEVKT